MNGLLRGEVGPVIQTISPKDLMFNEAYAQAYFRYGPSAVRCIELAMVAVGKRDLTEILDLPCGHGRVLRSLQAAFPTAQLTACDIDRDAVDFCADTFGATPVYSSDRVEDIELHNNFDLIWVGSLFTHFDDARWVDFLRFLETRLAPGGLLVFSTHGRWIAEQLRSQRRQLQPDRALEEEILADYENMGFGYRNYSHQDDYGISLSSPAWVVAQVMGIGTLRLVSYLERGWVASHDVVTCQRGFTAMDDR